jgi:hypothetical protein
MPSWMYLAVPLSILPIVLLFGFVGCFLDSEGQASPDDPENPENPDDPDDPEVPEDPYHTVIETTPDLVAYWPLGESSGTTAHDVVGPPPNGSHPGTYSTWTAPADAAAETDAANGVVALGQPGLIANDASRLAVSVDGGYVEVPFAAELNTPEFSFEVLVQTEWDATAIAAYRCVVSSRELAGGNVGGFILYANPTNHWEARIGVGTPVPAAAAAEDPPISFGAIEALAVTYDGATLSLYVNGDLRGSVQPELGTAYVPNAARPLLIGARELDDLSGPTYPFKGRLQEVACYSRALTQEEIVAHLKAGSI